MKNAIISILICIAINTTSTLLANELAHRINTIIEAPIKGKSQIETWRYENSCWKDVALVIKESCGEPLSTKPQLHRHYYKSHENWLVCMAALSSYLSQHPHPKGLFLANIESITILELPTKVDMYCIVTNTAVTDTPPLFINQEGIAITPTEEPWKTLLTHSTVFSAIKETPKPTLTPQPSLTQQLMSLRQSKELQESRQRTQLTDARTAAGPVATTTPSPRIASARPATTSASPATNVQDLIQALELALTQVDLTTLTQEDQRSAANLLYNSTEILATTQPQTARTPLRAEYQALITDLKRAGIEFPYRIEEATAEQLQEHKDLFLKTLLPGNEALFTVISNLKRVAYTSEISLIAFSFIMHDSPCILYYTKDIRPGVTGDACIFINELGEIFTSNEIELMSLVTLLGEIRL